MVKVIKTEVRQVIELEIPPGYIYDDKQKIDLNTFKGKVLVPVIKVNVGDKTNGH